MKQCLRCSKPCADTGIFCDDCRALVQHSQVEHSRKSIKHLADLSTTPLIVLSPDAGDIEADTLHEQPSVDSESAIDGAETRQADLEAELTHDTVEQTLNRLSDAARQVASIDAEQKRRPRASRLAPLLDISADIRRDSTPMLSPGVSGRRTDSWSTKLMDEWEDEDEDEDSTDIWKEGTDPLLRRPFPDRMQTERIEEEDIERISGRRAVAGALAPRPHLFLRSRPLRLITISIASLALAALIIDSILAAMAWGPHNAPARPVASGPPTMVLSASEVNYGQSVTLQVMHFTALARVILTRDVGEQIKTSANGPYVTMDRNGSASVSIIIDPDWKPGFHTIGAVDMVTHYTASVTLRVDSGSAHPSHLTLSANKLNFGSALQGANTILPLSLQNAGSGNINWSASSDQPWLLLTPAQGMFSKTQTVAIGVQRSGLQPGAYEGHITFSSSDGEPQVVAVVMNVKTLPLDAGAVLTVSPVVLSFAVVDGGGQPDTQVLSLNNPGNEPLYWSVSEDTSLFQGAPATDWLMTDLKGGIVPPGGSTTVHVSTKGAGLLPGSYLSSLLFAVADGHTALNNPQHVAVSLTVQPRCGIALSSGAMSFTAVAGQDNPSNQALTFWASASCSSALGWHASSSVPWLTMTPASGQLRDATAASIAVSVNTSGLKPGIYKATLSLATTMMTQVVSVQLAVQPKPAPSAPLMAASPLNLNFSTTIGQPDPPAQSVTITNTGGSPLTWHTQVNAMGASWLAVSPATGTIKPGGTAQVTVVVNTTSLPVGSYAGQIALSGSDANGATAGGSPQNIIVNFSVAPRCMLAQPSATALAFTAIQGEASPAAQNISINASGNCSWPLKWKAQQVGNAGWLHLASASGSLSSGSQTGVISVTADTSGLAPGNYTAQIKISATDSSSIAAGGSVTVPVTLTVTGVTANGTVKACDVAGCTSPKVLPGASVMLLDGTTRVASAIADQAGNFTFTNVPLGSYTLSASGTDGANRAYSGNVSVIVTRNQQTLEVTTLPTS